MPTREMYARRAFGAISLGGGMCGLKKELRQNREEAR